MSWFWNSLTVLVKRIVLVFILFSLTRLLFLVFNLSSFGELSFGELSKLFFWGIRFDASAIAYGNLVLVFLSLLPFRFVVKRFYQLALKIIFIVSNAVLLVANIADIEYFKFSKKRMSAYIFDGLGLGGTNDDILEQLPYFMFQFWYLTVIWLVIIYVLYKFSSRHCIEAAVGGSRKITAYVYRYIIFALFLILTLIAARGGVSGKPLSVIHASEYCSVQNMPLVLNSPFTVLRSINKQGLKEQAYFSRNVCDSVFTNKIDFSAQGRFEPKNVLILILESFGSEYCGFANNGKGYTPFLDSLSKHSFVFPHAFANGTQSIQSLPSILAGLPALMEKPYVASAYASNRINSLPEQLIGKGYATAFFHGATNGSMNFDRFVNLLGIADYFGRTEYADDSDFDGQWGIFDHSFLPFVASRLDKLPQPWFSGVFTLSSHHPYTLPEQFKTVFTQGEIPMHNAVQYVDYSLREFFNTIKDTEWYNKTLFVITADHTSISLEDCYMNDVGKYSIPLLFFCPADSSLQGMNGYAICQQADIFPSVLDYLGYSGHFACYGNSVFDARENYAVNFSNGLYHFVYKGYSLAFDGQKVTSLYKYPEDRMLTDNLTGMNLPIEKEIVRKLKAIIQNYNTNVIHNTLWVE